MGSIKCSLVGLVTPGAETAAYLIYWHWGQKLQPVWFSGTGGKKCSHRGCISTGGRKSRLTGYNCTKEINCNSVAYSGSGFRICSPVSYSGTRSTVQSDWYRVELGKGSTV